MYQPINLHTFIAIFFIVIGSLLPNNCLSNKLKLETKGVIIKVNDLDHAQEFYEGIIGFEVEKTLPDRIKFKTAGLELWCQKVDRKRDVKYGKEAHAILTLQTNELDSAIAVYKQKGVEFIREIKENGIGYSAPFRDPFGNVISILEQSKFPVPRFEEPKILNVGLYLPEIKSSEKFYVDKLGFKVRTKNYLPQVLPLNHHDNKSIAIILHNKGVISTDLDFKQDTQTNILFATESLKKTKALLTDGEVEWNETDNKYEISVQDPWGNFSLIQELK